MDRYNQFTAMDPAKGYQLYVTNPAGATVDWPQAAPSLSQAIPLSQGWNLIGSPRTQTLPVADALAPLVQGVDYDSVMELDPATGGYRAATTLQPGAAYWLRTLRPAALTIPAAASHAITYTYDGDGRRMSKTVNGVTTRFLYDGLETLAEFNGAGTLTTSYVHGPQIDELLAIRNHTTGTTLYPLTDHLGSLIALSDASGMVQATTTYSAFGATRSQTGAASNRFRFTGREFDPESGLYHFRARAYDPAAGRFLQPDPLPRTPADPRVMRLRYVGRLAAVNHPLPGAGFIGISIQTTADGLCDRFLYTPFGFNTYTYVSNRPLRLTDPLGLEGGDRELENNALSPGLSPGPGTLPMLQQLQQTNSRSQRSGDNQTRFLHGTDFKGAGGILRDGALRDGSWVTLPQAVDSATGRLAIFLSPAEYQRFVTINSPKGEWFVIIVAPNSSVTGHDVSRGGAPQFSISGEHQVEEVFPNLN